MEINKNKKLKQSWGILGSLSLLFVLSGCGETLSPYTLKLESGATNVYEFAEGFRDGSLGIYDGEKRLSLVTSSMIENFHTNVLTLDQDLPLKVRYQGKLLTTTYQVSSLYTSDKDHYSVKISYESLEVVSLGNPSKTATEFQIPSYSETLPSPLKDWPITAWSASFGGMDSLRKVTLSPVLKSFSPTPLASDIALYPYSTVDDEATSLINYEGNFLYLDSALAGIRSTASGVLSLPNQVDHFWDNAFAAPLPGVLFVELNSKYQAMDFTRLAQNLPMNQGFILDGTANGYFVNDGFLYYNDGTDVLLRGIPEGRLQDTASLTLPEGLTRFHLTTLDGFTAPGSAQVIFPSTLKSFTAPLEINNTTLKSLEFTSASMVKCNALSLKNLPSSLTSIKVPSALLATYQSDSVWGNVKNLLTD